MNILPIDDLSLCLLRDLSDLSEHQSTLKSVLGWKFESIESYSTLSNDFLITDTAYDTALHLFVEHLLELDRFNLIGRFKPHFYLGMEARLLLSNIKIADMPNRFNRYSFDLVRIGIERYHAYQMRSGDK